MEEQMSEDEQGWKVRDWLDQTVQPQDSVSVCGQMIETHHGETMIRANHGASDQQACERMWQHAQRQLDFNQL